MYQLTLFFFSRNSFIANRLDPRGFAKISDFGVSHLFEDEKSSTMLSPGSVTLSNEDNRIGRRKLTRAESDAALMMKSMSDSGFLTKTEGWVVFFRKFCSLFS